MDSGLICKGIVKKYKQKEALKGVDLTIEKGKIYGMIGRNGAGKTTLLSILTAQAKPTEGRVTLDGEKIWENQKALNRMCFSRELNPVSALGPNNMKVSEYLNIAATYYPDWDKEMEKRLAAEFGLDVKQKICKLSKGMLSMVTIIVAMASKAEYTLLDEPVAGLDVVAREQFYKFLLEEEDASGRTFLISTHIIEEAADLFEEVMILRDGKLLLKENTQQLLERSCHVSGRTDKVDEITRGMELHHIESMGRSRGVTVLMKQGEWLEAEPEVTIQPVSLQNLFVALCGEEA